MTSTLIFNARIVYPGERIADGALLLQGGRIAAIDPLPAAVPPDARRVDARARLVTPGLIDVHTHGVGHHLYEGSPEDLLAGLSFLARFGTTGVLPTLYRVMKRPSLPVLARLSEALDSARGVSVPGWHLEGPFLKLPGAGADTIPGDLGLLDELLAATGGRTRAMSISPDTPGILPVIERLVEQSVVPFITHTRASTEETERAIDAGARHATHFYDVFPLPDITEPGVRPCGAVEAILADPRCMVDFICDGVHVAPVAVRAALAAKGFGGILLITDSNIGAGLPDGIYPTTFGFPVKVSAGNAARIHDPGQPKHGMLAGSALTMNVGIANLLRWLKLPPEQIWAMGTSNPARLLGLPEKGVIKPGADADVVVWNSDLTPAHTWVAGEKVFDGT
ncbi:MAG: N-acetylglucosamine-6-phosphate deacetylase [Verrucomicrobia bacterium]|nr:N-acetylglucosamine-6-phosphate deacetylase [Verrucomicrobiota bacterium]